MRTGIPQALTRIVATEMIIGLCRGLGNVIADLRYADDTVLKQSQTKLSLT